MPRVISTDHSSITEKDLKKKLAVDSSMTNILVDTHMLRIDWVFNENSFGGGGSFGQLI